MLSFTWREPSIPRNSACCKPWREFSESGGRSKTFRPPQARSQAGTPRKRPLRNTACLYWKENREEEKDKKRRIVYNIAFWWYIPFILMKRKSAVSFIDALNSKERKVRKPKGKGKKWALPLLFLFLPGKLSSPKKPKSFQTGEPGDFFPFFSADSLFLLEKAFLLC